VAQGIERARRMGSGGNQARIERAKNFSWTRIAEQYRDFFEDVLAGSGQSRHRRSSMSAGSHHA
jgi:glycosyltransferase involved in cell wall biosynthesis